MKTAMRLGKTSMLAAALGLLAVAGLAAQPAAAEERAKDLFGAKKLPAAVAAQSIGFYSKGCFAGGVAIPMDGPNWEVMRPSRNRRWGHPVMIALVEKLSRDAAADGWPGLLIGDISQPRGGPMMTGHASHQIGLDADIWLTPMPSHPLSTAQRESMSATLLVDEKTHLVKDALWTPAHMRLLKRAASYPEVERILVNPGIKKKLCDTVTGDLVPAPEAAHPNQPALIFLIWFQTIFACMIYGPIAAYLVEAFPAKIRYTSVSLPYHIGNGVFGGLLPLIGVSLSAATGNIYAGLFYPIAVALLIFVVGTIFLKETHGTLIWDETGNSLS